MTWHATNGRKPKTGERQLRVRFANGRESINSYVAAQLRWNITGSEWDVAEVSRA